MSTANRVGTLRTPAFALRTAAARAAAAAGLYGAPWIGLPGLALPRFLGFALLGPGRLALVVGWVVFALIGVLWTGVYDGVRRRFGRWQAAVWTALANWAACSLLVLPTAPWWGVRLAASGISPPGVAAWLWSALAPLTLALAFGLSGLVYGLTAA